MPTNVTASGHPTIVASRPTDIGNTSYKCVTRGALRYRAGCVGSWLRPNPGFDTNYEGELMRTLTRLVAGGGVLATAIGVAGTSVPVTASADTTSPVVGHVYVDGNTVGSNTVDVL